MYRFFPFLSWLPELRDRTVWVADVTAGITVAMVLIPQAMAYAELAGLPAVCGLYAAFLPPAVAALFGSSRQLATGTVATAALISAAAVGPLAPVGSKAFVEYSLLLACMVGVIRLIMGVLKLGFLANLLSAPVVVGFTNAAALIIATSQLHKVFGVRAERGDSHMHNVWREVSNAPYEGHLPTVGMACLAGVLLVVFKRFFPRLPNVLIAVAITSLVAWFGGYKGSMVGAIPRGLPSLYAPSFDMHILIDLMPGAMTLVLIGLMEVMAIAKTMAMQTRERIDLNQELIGQGLANIVAGFSQSYTVSGSFSRSAINYVSGAKTGFSSVVTSAVVMATLLWLTPLFYYLPQATLALIIIVSVANLIRFAPLWHAWKINRQDGMIGVFTFITTFVFAPDLHWGIALGMGLSLAVNFYRTMRPNVAFLTRHLDGTLQGAGANQLRADQRIAIMRFDGRLYFGSSSYFEDCVLEATARTDKLRFLVVDAEGINQIDASGEQALRGIVEQLRAAGVDVYFTRAKPPLMDALERSKVIDYIGRDHFFRWNQHALEYLWARLEPEYKARCPLNMPHPQARSSAADEYYI
tara:strand:- start:1785 stop:3530 length:1746 start_codon:yes stop_codon:yes gene_type:complete